VNWGVQKHILAGFAVALVVIFATFVISYRNTESLIETSQLVAQRENLLIELERTLSAVKDIQSGQRGYALSGNPDMLEAYRIGREEMPGLLRRLERFTAGNPEEQQQVAILQGAIAQRIRTAEEIVAVVQAGDEQAAEEMIESGEGNRQTERIRGIVLSMAAQQRQQLDTMLVEARDRTQAARIITVFLNFLIMTLFVLTAAVFTRHIQTRNRAERELMESESRYRDLFENASDLIQSVSPDGRFRYVNPAWRKALGYSEDEIGRMKFLDVVHPAYHERCGELFRKLLAGGEVGRVEVLFVMKGGSLLPLEGSVTCRFENGKAVATRGIFRDIREQKRIEQEMRQAKEAAEAANRAKGDFLANMSHEIRTPLNGIIGMTELTLGTPITPEQREYLSMIRTSADALLSVVNDVLDFSKIEAGRLDIESIEFRLSECVGDLMKGLAFRADEKKLELAYEIPPEVPELLVGDPTRLSQIIVNLVGNAIKFTDHGEVVLRVELEARKESEARLHFSVSDTGIGIPRERQQAIFESFSQADASTTRRYGGTGLGLAIASRLVELMRGTIWVESELSRGSTFHFTATVGVSRSLLPERRGERDRSLAGVRALIVDDNATNRRFLEELFAHWEMSPATAASGSEALAEMDRASQAGTGFDLLVTDFLMPDMDGFALLESVRANPAFSRLPVVLLSSSGAQQVARSRELGVSAHLIKPAKQSELREAVTTALGKSRAAEPVPSVLDETAAAKHAPLSILLTEDNPVNQRLATRVLELNGHSVTVAATGRQALSALASGTFDLILMDVQMPEMDGLDATAAIREQERQSGGHIPIIAMTAHAMAEDRDRCLEAGMDGYVSKPLHLENLWKAINECVPKASRPSIPKAVKPDGNGSFDRNVLLSQVGGDHALMREIAKLFLEESPRQMEAIRRAIEQRDGKGLELSAHTFKGSAGHLAARRVSELAGRLEAMGREGKMDSAAESYETLEREWGLLTAALSEYSAERNS
jgi:PAS domain S-box-containing protein